MSSKARFVLLPVLAALAVLALSACGGATPQPAATQPPVAQPAETQAATQAPASGAGEISKNFQTDPAQATDPDSAKVAGYVYEGLVKASGGAVQPGLARSWTVSEDGLAYTFSLFSNAAFSDGTPVTADVVVANFNRWFDSKDANRGSGAYQAFADAFGGFKGETGSGGAPKSEFDGIEKVDSLTVLLHLNRPDPDLLKKLAGAPFSIVLKSGDKLLGSGPNVMGATTATTLTLDPNTKYWQGAPGQPLVFTLK